MTKAHFLLTILSAITAISLVSLDISNHCKSSEPPGSVYGLSMQTSPKAEFRYILFENDVESSNSPKIARRTVSVLLDKASFSEETLKKLFALVSKRFPEPAWLQVDVYTSLEQLRTPEEAELPKVSGQDSSGTFYNHPYALFMRIEGNELFRYYPNPPSRERKTVIIKGRDPFDPKSKSQQ